MKTVKWTEEAIDAAFNYNQQIDVQYREEVVMMLVKAARVQFQDASIVDSQDLGMSGDDIYMLVKVDS